MRPKRWPSPRSRPASPPRPASATSPSRLASASAWIGGDRRAGRRVPGNPATTTNYYPVTASVRPDGTVLGPDGSTVTAATRTERGAWTGGRNGVRSRPCWHRLDRYADGQHDRLHVQRERLTNINKAAVTAGTAFGALGTIPADKWGIIVDAHQRRGHDHLPVGPSNYAGGYRAKPQRSATSRRFPGLGSLLSWATSRSRRRPRRRSSSAPMHWPAARRATSRTPRTTTRPRHHARDGRVNGLADRARRRRQIVGDTPVTSRCRIRCTLQKYTLPEFYAEAPARGSSGCGRSPRSAAESLASDRFRKFTPRDDWFFPERPIWALYRATPKHLVEKDLAEAMFEKHWSELFDEGEQVATKALRLRLPALHVAHAGRAASRRSGCCKASGAARRQVHEARESLPPGSGAVDEPFPIGWFPACPFDERAVEHILERDRLIQAGNRFDELEKENRPEWKKAEDDAADCSTGRPCSTPSPC
jgi:hypothetical protein